MTSPKNQQSSIDKNEQKDHLTVAYRCSRNLIWFDLFDRWALIRFTWCGSVVDCERVAPDRTTAERALHVTTLRCGFLV